MKAMIRASALLAGTILSLPAMAQTPPLPNPGTAQARTNAHDDRVSALDEIVVTGARRRSEIVQDAPIAVAVVSREQLAAGHGTNLTAIAAFAPSLQLNEAALNTGVPAIYLRGFGSRTGDPSIDPAVALYVDGIYQGSNTGSFSDLFDVDRVEVLRGPQGIILGKNAPSGAISISTRRPTGEWGGELQADYGRFDATALRARLDFPIIAGVLAGKVAASRFTRGSYIRNTVFPDLGFGGFDHANARAALLFTPSDQIDWYVSAEYNRKDDEQRGLRNVSSATGFPRQNPSLSCTLFRYCDYGTEPYTTASDFSAPNRDHASSLTSNLDIRLGAVTLTAINGVRKWSEVTNSDIDGTPSPILHALDNRYDTEQQSHEFRIASRDGGGLDLGGRLNWLVGGYLFRHSYDAAQTLVVFGGAPLNNDQAQVTRTRAVFASAEYKLTDALSVSGGARRTHDEKDHSFVSTGFPESSRVFQTYESDNTSVEVGAKYQIQPGRMVYVRYAEGYRAGGILGLPGAPADAGTFRPETVESYEAGFKGDFLDRRLRLNLTAFHAEYTDLQRATARRSNAAARFVIVTQNAAASTTDGVELETVLAPANGLTIRANLAYLDARYTSFTADLLGNGVATDNRDARLSFAPDWSGNIGVNQEISLPSSPLGFERAVFDANYNWRSAQTVQDLDPPIASQDAYGLLDASLSLITAGDRYTVSIFGRNLLDERYIVWGEPTGGLATTVFDGLPRTYGLSLSASF